MIKAAKKLKKFWPRKKKRKKPFQDSFYYLPPPALPIPPPPPPRPFHYCCSRSSPVQPSAPPLPPWLETEQSISVPELAYASNSHNEEIAVETNPPLLSYQRYTVSNPVYGVPVGQTPRRERSGGIFGCVLNFGANLIRCFCPCFHIREID